MIFSNTLAMRTYGGASGEEQFMRFSGNATNQVDIPHLVDWQLKRDAADRSIPWCYGGEDAVSYDTYITSRNTDTSVDSVTVCPSPTFLNSGAHRVLLEATYRGEPYVIAVEEIEAPSCLCMGEAVYIGAWSATGRFFEDDAELRSLLDEALYAAIGVNLKPNPINDNPIRFYESDPEDIFAQGCTLSAEARSCLLTRPFL